MPVVVGFHDARCGGFSRGTTLDPLAPPLLQIWGSGPPTLKLSRRLAPDWMELQWQY